VTVSELFHAALLLAFHIIAERRGAVYPRAIDSRAPSVAAF
jgi:hypothetical protein